jgi:hypothetical protein
MMKRGIVPVVLSGAAEDEDFDPSSVTGLVRDWDFADTTKLYTDIAHTTSVTADGDPIGSIVDGVGGTVYLTASGDDTTRPTYETGIQNGLSVARFDGSNDYLSNATAITADASQTIFLVVKKRGAVSGTGQVLMYGTSSSQLYTDSDSPSTTGYNWYANSAPAEVAIGTTPTNWNILAFKVTSAAAMAVYANGGAAAASFDPHDDITTTTNLAFGAQSGGTLPGDYDIGRILVYSAALSDADLNTVFSGLGTLWDITVSAVS